MLRMIRSRESSSLLKLLKRCGLANIASETVSVSSDEEHQPTVVSNPGERIASTQKESTRFPAAPGDESPFKATAGCLCFHFLEQPPTPKSLLDEPNSRQYPSRWRAPQYREINLLSKPQSGSCAFVTKVLFGLTMRKSVQVLYGIESAKLL